MKGFSNLINNFRHKMVFPMLSIAAIILLSLLIITTRDFLESMVKLENISIQIESVKIADEHDLSKMGANYKDKIFEKYETVKFGKYYQSAINNFKTPIEWIVLAKENNRALLLSKYILDCKPFNYYYDKCYWYNSYIRKWLNDNFYDTAFDSTEKKLIIESKLENKKYIDSFATDPVKDGPDTIDRVFLLSDAEFLKYLSANRFYQDPEEVEKNRVLSIELWGENKNELSFNYDNAATKGTQYAYKQGLKNAMLEDTANYWLRTNAGRNEWVMFVSYKGWTFWDAANAKIYGIRPAIWVALE